MSKRCVHATEKKSLELTTMSVHVNKTDQGQFFGAEGEQRHAHGSPFFCQKQGGLVHAACRAGSLGCALPGPTLGQRLVVCLVGHRVDLCQAMCQQATSLLVHRSLSPRPGLLQFLQTRLPGVSQQPETDHFAWPGANLSSWTAHINSGIVDEYLI